MESALLELADGTPADKAVSDLAEAEAGFATTAKAIGPADLEIESAVERLGRWTGQATRRADEARAERSDLAAKLFKGSSKANLDSVAVAFATHDNHQQVLRDVILLAESSIEAAKQRRAAASLAHLKAELTWTKAKAVCEAKDLLALVKPLLEFDQTVNVDASGKLSVYLARIAELENIVLQKGQVN